MRPRAPSPGFFLNPASIRPRRCAMADEDRRCCYHDGTHVSQSLPLRSLACIFEYAPGNGFHPPIDCTISWGDSIKCGRRRESPRMSRRVTRCLSPVSVLGERELELLLLHSITVCSPQSESSLTLSSIPPKECCQTEWIPV